MPTKHKAILPHTGAPDGPSLPSTAKFSAITLPVKYFQVFFYGTRNHTFIKSIRNQKIFQQSSWIEKYWTRNQRSGFCPALPLIMWHDSSPWAYKGPSPHLWNGGLKMSFLKVLFVTSKNLHVNSTKKIHDFLRRQVKAMHMHIHMDTKQYKTKSHTRLWCKHSQWQNCPARWHIQNHQLQWLPFSSADTSTFWR